MSHLVLSLAWCWCQVFVVAGLTVALAAAATRVGPKAGAAVAWAGVVAVLALTALAPLPAGQWSLVSRSLGRVSSVGSLSGSSLPRAEIEQPRHEPPHDPSSMVAVRGELLRNLLASLEQSQSVVVNQEAACQVVVGLIVTWVLLSLARLVGGFRAVLVLSRNGHPIDDEDVARLTAELRHRMGLFSSPQVRETSALVSAAVVGWWRPAVVLPGEWRNWSPAELKAVLAHELAHVYRRDSFSRLLTAVTAALHCAQPLMYWLRWQLMLAQELAADEIAARAVGNRSEYLEALTRLALRLDSRPIVGPEQMLLPVFSGFLLRRITMLRAKDGSMRRGMQAPVQWSAIATLVVACVVATAIRGLAQPPDAESDESIRVARINDAKSRPAAAVQARQLLPAFQRPPFDPAAVAMHDGGGFIVRVGEFLARSDLGVQTRALNEAFAEGWKNAFPAADPIAWPLQDIEYIAGDFNLIVKRMENPPDENHPNTVMLGTNCVVIRWKKPLGGQYQTLAQFPGAVEKEHDGKKYVELPVIPILGPSKPCVCQLDDHTLLGGFSEAGLQRRLDRLSAGAARPSWHKSWLAVEGGVMTVVALDSQIVRPLGGPADNDVEKLAHDLVTHVRQYAVGVEWCEPAVGASVIKARLGCETKEAAELVRSSLQGLVDQAMSELRRVAEADGEGAKIASSYLKPLREAKLEIHQVDEGWQVALELSGNVDVQALWKP